MIHSTRDFGPGTPTALCLGTSMGRSRFSERELAAFGWPAEGSLEDVPSVRETIENDPNKDGNMFDGPEIEDFRRLERGQIDVLCINGRYRVDSWLECGGMASIYVGEDSRDGRPVAIKVLTDDCEALDITLQRFISEARLSCQIRHPNVVEVLDWGTTPQGVMYIVMELLRGEDLHATLERRGHLPWARVRELMLQLCAGLEAVHAQGVVHRDVKPANCFRVVHEDGRETLKLVDFGIATLTPAALAGQVLGVEGEIIGTPEYMSPEQARGEKVDQRADVYSAGVILCELLTGRPPVQGKTHSAVLTEQVYGQIAPLSQLAPLGVVIDPRLEAIHAKALAKDPAERYASVSELAAAIAAVPAHKQAQVSGAFTELPLALARSRVTPMLADLADEFATDEVEIASSHRQTSADEAHSETKPEGRMKRARSWLRRSIGWTGLGVVIGALGVATACLAI